MLHFWEGGNWSKLEEKRKRGQRLEEERHGSGNESLDFGDKRSRKLAWYTVS